ncbi:MAG: quinolinate synthase NadA, partial [Flavobacteriaceae bacterium]|nr:quinolinate synthase NadA [Flavobacteriaceae bacterium]
MKLNTLEKLYLCLKYEQPEIQLNDELIRDAYLPIQRMLDLK